MNAVTHVSGAVAPEAYDDDERAAIESEPTSSVSTSIASVLARWSVEGPLVRQPTGITAIDTATRGGIAFGDAWILAGAPDAAKTATVVQIGDTWARAGVVVGIVAADAASGPDAVVTRLAQRRGYDRARIEARSPATLAALRGELGNLPVIVYGGDATIEAAALDLVKRARSRRARAGLIVDSIHAATSDREIDPRAPMRDAVAARVRAIVALAARERIAVIATAEMSRATYGAPEDAKADIAAGAETRVLDYAPAAKLVARRSSEGQYVLTIVRSKSGGSGTTVYLELDYARMTLLPTDAPPPPPSAEERRAARDRARDENVKKRDAEDDAVATRLRAENPTASVRALVALIRSARGCGGERAQAAELRTRQVTS